MLYLVRHGQTDWNKDCRLQGTTDIPLNETGFVQALQAKEALKNIKFDKVFCSPLLRAKQTCQTIWDGAVEIDDRLKERSFGCFEGYKSVDLNYAEMWIREHENDFPDVESMTALQKRVFEFLDEVAAKFAGKNVLVVCHGGVSRFFKIYFKQIDEGCDLHLSILDNGAVATFSI